MPFLVEAGLERLVGQHDHHAVACAGGTPGKIEDSIERHERALIACGSHLGQPSPELLQIPEKQLPGFATVERMPQLADQRRNHGSRAPVSPSFGVCLMRHEIQTGIPSGVGRRLQALNEARDVRLDALDARCHR